jgi:hypothetical protein
MQRPAAKSLLHLPSYDCAGFHTSPVMDRPPVSGGDHGENALLIAAYADSSELRSPTQEN